DRVTRNGGGILVETDEDHRTTGANRADAGVAGDREPDRIDHGIDTETPGALLRDSDHIVLNRREGGGCSPFEGEVETRPAEVGDDDFAGPGGLRHQQREQANWPRTEN